VALAAGAQSKALNRFDESRSYYHDGHSYCLGGSAALLTLDVVVTPSWVIWGSAF
jgi:hypothetical protein